MFAVVRNSIFLTAAYSGIHMFHQGATEFLSDVRLHVVRESSLANSEYNPGLILLKCRVFCRKAMFSEVKNTTFCHALPLSVICFKRKLTNASNELSKMWKELVEKRYFSPNEFSLVKIYNSVFKKRFYICS
jgi:hypothetical protein